MRYYDHPNWGDASFYYLLCTSGFAKIHQYFQRLSLEKDEQGTIFAEVFGMTIKEFTDKFYAEVVAYRLDNDNFQKFDARRMTYDIPLEIVPDWFINAEYDQDRIGDKIVIKDISDYDLQYSDVAVIDTNNLPRGGNFGYVYTYVIGLPGDRIEINDRKIYRNGKQLDDDFISRSNIDAINPVSSVTLLPGQYFVWNDTMGIDSRHWGPIDSEIIREVYVRITETKISG
jgi:signal peptidase I